MWATILSGLKSLAPKSTDPYHVQQVNLNAEKNADATVAIAAAMAVIVVLVAATVIFSKK